jgi:hypothetical protein
MSGQHRDEVHPAGIAALAGFVVLAVVGAGAGATWAVWEFLTWLAAR